MRLDRCHVANTDRSRVRLAKDEIGVRRRPGVFLNAAEARSPLICWIIRANVSVCVLTSGKRGWSGTWLIRSLFTVVTLRPIQLYGDNHESTSDSQSNM